MPPTTLTSRRGLPYARLPFNDLAPCIEQIPIDQFVPPHCPRETCPAHDPDRAPQFRWQRSGFHDRQKPPLLVPRFKCLTCARDFSLMTFATTYWLKRPELQQPIVAALVAGSGHRQAARSLGCAHSTVTRQAARIGRHAILTQTHLTQTSPREASTDSANTQQVVFDDFEAFVGSQFYPVAVGTAVCKRSALVLDLEVAPHARGGKLNRYERVRRAELYARWGPPPRGERTRAFRRLLDRLLTRAGGEQRLVLITDDHTDYRTVVSRHPQPQQIVHLRYRNPRRGPKGAPRSAEARARDAALFEVDQLHRLLRHSQAAHRRETIAFARRVSGVMERAFAYAVWRNLVKARSERHPALGTPAMQAGLTDHAWGWGEVFRKRLFPSLARCLPASWQRIYRRKIVTPNAPPQRPHEPVFVH
jgi:transposase-like protein